MQGKISSPHLSTALLYNLSWRWSLYLNRCVAEFGLEDLVGNISFTLDPILLKMEGGHYIDPIIPGPVSDIFAVRRSGGGGAKGGGSGAAATVEKVGTSRGTARLWVRYDVHLTSLSLWYGENLRTLLAWTVIHTLQGRVICKNWHLCGLCWEDCERKNLHVSTPPP